MCEESPKHLSSACISLEGSRSQVASPSSCSFSSSLRVPQSSKVKGAVSLGPVGGQGQAKGVRGRLQLQIIITSTLLFLLMWTGLETGAVTDWEDSATT